MVYTVYKTVNLINGKFHLGVHKTSNPNDEYLGSGNYIIRAVAKYGKASFKKEILFEYDTQEGAWDKEDELVELHRKDPLCMNQRKGGSGGFDYINKVGRNVVGSQRGGEATKARMSTDLGFRKDFARKMRPLLDKAILKHDPVKRGLSGIRGAEKWRGSHHSEESRHIISKRMTGVDNPMFGLVWVSHPELGSKRVKPDCVEEGWTQGRR